MKWLMLTVLTGLLSMLLASETSSLEVLIDQLQETEAVGFGYSSRFSGTAFSPLKDAAQVSSGVLGEIAPHKSETMAKIVQLGSEAIPALLAHVGDNRKTRIAPVLGMMWMAWDDEYDYNRRTATETPVGVNRRSFGEEGHPTEHQITVGDLCFVALGQIVNRSFSSTRYQPTGGVVVSSPSESQALLAAIRHEYTGMGREELQRRLVDDFEHPDHEGRRIGAMWRLFCYYPELFDDLVVKQLWVPTFDVFEVNKFVREQLYPEKDLEKRRALVDLFVTARNQAVKDGILQQLFCDLNDQIADDEGRLSPPLDPKYEARQVLMQAFGFPKSVLPSDSDYCESWSTSERARFIKSLGHVISRRITDEVHRIFCR